MTIDASVLLNELNISNVNKDKLEENVEKALRVYTKAEERLRVANDALDEVENNEDVEQSVVNLIRSMESLGLNEKTIRSAVRVKFGGKRSSNKDNGVALTDELKCELLEAVTDSKEDGFTITQLVQQFGVRRNQTTMWVKTLISNGTIRKVGDKRNTRYFFEEEELVANYD